MSPEIVTFEHEGTVYEVQDYVEHGIGLRRVSLNSRHAEFRKFLSRDPKVPDRLFPFRRMNYGKSDPATLAEQFRLSGAMLRER